MITVAQRYLAIKRIVGNPERLGEFNEEQRKKLKKMGESAELEVRVAITRIYRHLYYPQADAGQEQGNLAYEQLPAQERGREEPDRGRAAHAQAPEKSAHRRRQPAGRGVCQGALLEP